MKRIFPIIFGIALVLTDQLSKHIIRSSGGFYVCNKGIAFGLEVSNYLFFLLWSIIIVFLISLLISKFQFQSSNQVQTSIIKKFDIWILDFIWNNLDFGFWIFSLILILSGALSNIIDRLYFSCVTDFIDLKIWPVFNLADCFIVIGVIIILIKISKK
jgi:lipoprotein signal peptidase